MDLLRGHSRLVGDAWARPHPSPHVGTPRPTRPVKHHAQQRNPLPHQPLERERTRTASRGKAHGSPSARRRLPGPGLHPPLLDGRRRGRRTVGLDRLAGSADAHPVRERRRHRDLHLRLPVYPRRVAHDAELPGPRVRQRHPAVRLRAALRNAREPEDRLQPGPGHRGRPLHLRAARPGPRRNGPRARPDPTEEPTAEPTPEPAPAPTQAPTQQPSEEPVVPQPTATSSPSAAVPGDGSDGAGPDAGPAPEPTPAAPEQAAPAQEAEQSPAEQWWGE